MAAPFPALARITVERTARAASDCKEEKARLSSRLPEPVSIRLASEMPGAGL
ncbi:MAG: hypothetical protein ABIP91_01060 [Sphingomicrobium sp.]